MRQLKITKSITNRNTASLDKYLQDIGREALITAEEEVELARRIKNGHWGSADNFSQQVLKETGLWKVVEEQEEIEDYYIKNGT